MHHIHSHTASLSVYHLPYAHLQAFSSIFSVSPLSPSTTPSSLVVTIHRVPHRHRPLSLIGTFLSLSLSGLADKCDGDLGL
jgi:hypothetical protein